MIVAVYAVALGKGGSTKTTTAAELAAGLARSQRRVLAIDLDQQGNLTTRLGINRATTVDAVAADVLTGDATPARAAIPAPAVPGTDVIAGTQSLADVESRQEIIVALRETLPQAHNWDDVVIDTPPALGTLTLTALAAADVVTAAVACETEAYVQLDRLVKIIAYRIEPMLRPSQTLHWIVPTRYDSRRRLDREVVEILEKRFPGQVTTPVREAVAARDAYTAAQPASIYAPRSKIAADYTTALAPILANSTTGAST